MDDTPDESRSPPWKFPSLPPWKLPYASSVQELRVPALIGVLVLHTLALVPSFLQHFFVLKKDPNVDLSYSLSSWIGCAICACFAVPGYWLMTAPLLAVHGVITAIAGSAMTVAQILVYFSAQMKCTDVQSASLGCSTCPCALESSCNAGEVGSDSDDVACTTCLAWGRDTCETILNSGVLYWGAWVVAPFLTAAAAISIVISQRISSERQAVTDSVEDSHKTIVEAHTALQQAGRLPTAEAESLRAALQDLWRSEREEFRLEARQFVADAVAHGHNAFESALPDENVNTHRSQKTTGSKVVPQPPEEENLSLHLIAGTPPRSGQSSPDFVIDVGDSINVDADELSDRVRVRNAPSLTLSPTSPGPAESPLVGSPDPAGLLGSHVMQDDSQASRKVAIGGASVEAWGSLEKDGSPRRESEGGKKSRKKKSKDKDKAKSKESKESSAVEGGDDQEGKGKKKDKKSKKKNQGEDEEEPAESPKKDQKSKGKKKDEEPEGEASKKDKKSKDSKGKDAKDKDSKDKKEKSKKEKKANNLV